MSINLNIDRIVPDMHVDENGKIVWTPRLIDYKTYYRGHTIKAEEFNTELLKQTYQGNYNTDTISVLIGLYNDLNADVTQKTNTANTNASEALRKAGIAEANSTEALSTANAAFETSNNAFTEATSAVNTSISAKTIAENSLNISESAMSLAEDSSDRADNALNIANEAIEIAETADSVAVFAKAESAEAKSISETANTNSTNALNTAKTANTNSVNAVNTANTALNTANTADTNADTALSTANTALENSKTAISTANTASSNSTTALSNSNDAVSKSNTALANSTTAVSTSSTANTNAAEALEKATEALTKVTQGLGTQIKVAGELVSTWDADTKLDKTANAVSATKATQDGNGAVIASTYLPLSGGTMSGALDMNNLNIENVNNLSFIDPGKGEGLRWNGGNIWQICECPDDLTNAKGNLQFIQNDVRKATIKTDGTVESTGGFTLPNTTNTHINGNKGVNVAVNITAAAGYNILSRIKSTNGVFTQGVHKTGYNLYYTSDTKIANNTNSVDKMAVLLDETGNSIFPGNITTSGTNLNMQDTSSAYTEDLASGASNVRKSLYFTDKNNAVWGAVEIYKYAGANAERAMQLNVRNKAGTWMTAKEGTLRVIIASDGTSKTFAAAPATLANDKRIATTQWAVEKIDGTTKDSSTFNATNLKTVIGNIEFNASGDANLVNADNSISGVDPGVFHHIINMGGSTRTNYGSQITMPYVNTLPYNKMLIRTANNTTWRKWSEVITDDPTQLLREKYIRTLKICINDTTEDTSNGDYRWPLASPIAYSTDKRYLVGVNALNTRYSNATQNIYAQNNVLYSSVFAYKNPSIDRAATTGPSSDIYNQAFQIRDKNDKTLCAIESGWMKDRKSKINIICYKGTSATDNSNARIEVGWNADGTSYSYCGPSPAASSKDNSIATTKWVKSLATPNLTDTTEHTYNGNAVVVKSWISSDKNTWYRVWSDGFKECWHTRTKDWTYAIWDESFTFPVAFTDATHYYANVSYSATGLEASDAAVSDRTRMYVQSWSAPIYSRTNAKVQFIMRGGTSIVIYACGY